ncbi:MAG TPA: hypothetical protein VNL94_08300 [Candidatus Binatia bacterium]|nr:hypothetical protein [Candidatus Binatia bacterium]
MFAQLSRNERLALVAAILVEITSLMALGDAWGLVMVVTFLASVGAIYVLAQPWIAPEQKLPAPKGLALLAMGVIATLATGITALQYIEFIGEEIADPETVIFLAGLVFAVILAWTGWVAYRAEHPATAASTPSTPSAPPAPPASEPPAASG